MLWRAITPFVLLALLSGSRTFAATPQNLDHHKAAIRTYIDRGAYAEEVATVALAATQHLTWRIPRGAPAGKKLAVVFDIDETALSNLPYLLAQDFSYVESAWESWVQSGQALAIVPIQTIYDLAVRNKLAVFFITGRDESQRTATEKNLRHAGYNTWTKLYFKPTAAAGSPQTSADYKTSIRRQLGAEGYVIIANLGDQESDLVGGFSEKIFKLPNPFYETK